MSEENIVRVMLFAALGAGYWMGLKRGFKEGWNECDDYISGKIDKVTEGMKRHRETVTTIEGKTITLDTHDYGENR